MDTILLRAYVVYVCDRLGKNANFKTETQIQAQERVNIKNINASTKRNISRFSLDCAPICLSHVCTLLYGRPNVSILAKLYSLSLHCSFAVANTYSLSLNCTFVVANTH